MDAMNREGLRALIRTLYGWPDEGSVPDARLNRALNNALRHMWGDIPPHLLKAEWRFLTEPPIEAGTATLLSTSNQVVTCSEALGTWPDDGTLTGRVIEIQDTDGRWIQRGIQGVFNQANHDCIALSEPWVDSALDPHAYRIYTPGYPIPGNVQDIVSAVLDPEGGTADLTVVSSLLDRKVGAWRQTGTPSECARTRFLQLPAPHFTPMAGTPATNPAATAAWGFDTAGVERGSTYGGAQYGAAGTFSYRAAIVFGRYTPLRPTKAGHLQPWMMSAPSPPTAQVTSTWGQGYIPVTCPDIDYLMGFSKDPTSPLYRHSGFEIWWFRARHASEDPTAAGNHAAHKVLENDGVYLLWAITPAYVTTVYDRGDLDPPDRSYPLVDMHGHWILEFDTLPTEAVQTLLETIRRPPTLEYDTDVPGIPPECLNLFFDLVAAYQAGKDGDVDAGSMYFKRYTKAVERMALAGAGPTRASSPAKGSAMGLRRGIFDQTRVFVANSTIKAFP